MNVDTNEYQDVSRRQLIEELRWRAALMCSGEAMDLLCRERQHFVTETGQMMRVLAARLDENPSNAGDALRA